MRRGTGAQFLRFAVAGVAGLVTDVAVLYLALSLGSGFYAGRVLSFLAAVWVTWRINRRYTFVAGDDAWREWWRYLTAMLGGGVVNYAASSATVLLLPPWPVTPALAVAVGSVAGMGINFLSAKLLVFKR
ncbi:GtrA family protein [Oxalobacteraceae bacterium OTU3REALA1]|nr:GtrA family protein [Oxalobacteraceae bacterium OTU3REALA1]